LHGGWQTADVVFVADALRQWLIEQLGDASRRKLTELTLGSQQERPLQRSADASVCATAEEMSLAGGEEASQVAVVSARCSVTRRQTYRWALEGLRAGIAGQLAVVDDAELTYTRQSGYGYD
jgi:hypothetical protein